MDSTELIREWAEELSRILGRSVNDIEETGLHASDFSGDYDLCIEFMDGSRLDFKYAFYAVRETSRQIAVFSEHCGHHIFPSHGATVMHVRREWQYSHSL